MASEMDKENIAEGLDISSALKPALSPHKTNRKSRSKSIGPGGTAIETSAPLKEDHGNRRKSAFVPAAKSILSREDDTKRREARRKSLATRRVSFAPEATLHTWDVIEYMRDATTSSEASNSTGRPSRSPQRSQQPSDDSEPPSTPPEQVEETRKGSTPGNQRDKHQKKYRRRSSGIPPMNFNNPDDVFSSSPFTPSANDDQTSKDDENIAMGLGTSNPVNRSSQVDESPNSTGSSARLDEALRQAAQHAETRNVELDEDGDQTMDIANDEITAAFKPWVQKTAGTPKPRLTRDLSSTQDQENVNPFSTTPVKIQQKSPSKALLDEGEGGDDEEMSMDITKAVGGIIPTPAQTLEDDGTMTMDLTTAIGGIQIPQANKQLKRRVSLKRRRSSANAPLADSQGSPAKKRQSNRRVSLFPRQNANDGDIGEGTMDLTMMVGGIQPSRLPNMDDRRISTDTSFGEEPMDLTMIMGGIQQPSNEPPAPQPSLQAEDSETSQNEELSMEMTDVVGGLDNKIDAAEPQQLLETPRKNSERPTTPPQSTPLPNSPPMPAHGAEKHGVNTPDRSPKKSPKKDLTPESKVVTNVNPPSPFIARPSQGETVKRSPSPKDKVTEGSSPVRTKSPRKSLRNGDVSTPDKEQKSVSQASHKNTLDLTSSLKLMSTPAKQETKSPIKRSLGTPHKSPASRKVAFASTAPLSTTPKRSSPLKKQVHLEEASPSNEAIKGNNENSGDDDVSDEPPISLHDFLKMTNIEFMDLTTAKRRHTAMPASFERKLLRDGEGDDISERPSLEDCVVAGACTASELEMFQHICKELRGYISGAKRVLRDTEQRALKNNPPLFRDYMHAEPEIKAFIDTQLKNMKANARLYSRQQWYQWRTAILRDLKTGFAKLNADFEADDRILTKQEGLVLTVLPTLEERAATLEAEKQTLQSRADELADCDQDELQEARETLSSVERQVEEKRRYLESLQAEAKSRDEEIDAIKERKAEYAAEIKEADRVKEENRGWSATEVRELKAHVDALEATHGWTITSSSNNPQTLTLAYQNDLQLFLHPDSFPTSTKPNPEGEESTPISLSYVGDEATPHPRTLTTTKRFFLQLLRAHLHCIIKSRTPLPSLLRLIAGGWDQACAVEEGARKLRLSYPTSEAIKGDETMLVESNILLTPALRTKVRLGFEIGAAVGEGGDVGEIKTEVRMNAQVVYGQRYKEEKMALFLQSFAGNDIKDKANMDIWVEAAKDLRMRLIATGRKD